MPIRLLPVFSRHPLDAPLVTQLVRPVVHAAYGQLIREPLAGEFGCSPRFAAHCMAEPVWESELGTAGIDIWLTAAALAGRFPIVQPVLGPGIQAAGGVKPSLPELFQQVVGALFTCLELHESFWLARQDESVECRVSSLDGQGATVPTMDVARAVETFRRDAKSLLPVLDRVVTPSTLEGLRGLVEVNAEQFRYPDTLWVDTVYEFAASHHRGAIHRQHVMQAFVPLYSAEWRPFSWSTAPRLRRWSTSGSTDCAGSSTRLEGRWLAAGLKRDEVNDGGNDCRRRRADLDQLLWRDRALPAAHAGNARDRDRRVDDRPAAEGVTRAVLDGRGSTAGGPCRRLARAQDRRASAGREHAAHIAGVLDRVDRVSAVRRRRAGLRSARGRCSGVRPVRASLLLLALSIILAGFAFANLRGAPRSWRGSTPGCGWHGCSRAASVISF